MDMDFESEESALFFKRLLSRHRQNSEPEYSFCRSSRICYADTPRDKIRCRCGETLTRTSDGDIQQAGLDWDWSGRGLNDPVRPGVKFHRTHVLCHEMLSQGTVVVRGESPLQLGWHHYFEVKILTKLYGTDTMIGLCTDKFDSAGLQEQYTSALGSDSQSWGYSFHGRKQEAGVTDDYGKLYGKGSIVGVYVNMVAGSVEFFLNRVSLGVAFSGLRALGLTPHQIYPAVCTTAAGTAFRLITAQSVPDSLQLRATRTAVNRIPQKSRAFLPSPIIRLLARYPWFEYQPSEALVSCRLLAPRHDNFVVTIPPAEPVNAGRRWNLADLPWNVPSTRQDVYESIDSPIGVARSRLSSSPDSSFCDLTSGLPSTSSHRFGSARPFLATLASGGSADPSVRQLPLEPNRRRKLRVCRDEDLSDEDDSAQLQLGWTKAKEEKYKKESKVLKEQESSSIVKKPPRKRCASSSKASFSVNLAVGPLEGSEVASKRPVKRRRMTTSSASSSQDTAGATEGCLSKCFAVTEGTGCSSGVSSFGVTISHDHVEETVQKSAKSGESKDAGEPGREGTTSDVHLPLTKKAASRKRSSSSSTTKKTATSGKPKPLHIKLMFDSVSEQSSGAIDEDLVEPGPSTVTANIRRSASVRSVCTTFPAIPEAKPQDQLTGLEPITEETSSSAPLSPSKDAGEPVKDETTSVVNIPLPKKAATRRRSSSASSRLTTKKIATSGNHEQVAWKLDYVSEQSLGAIEVGMVGPGLSTVTANRRRSTSVRSVCTTFPAIQEVELQDQLGGLGHIVEETSSSAYLSPSKDAGRLGREETTSGVNLPLPKKAATRRRSSSASSRFSTNKTSTSDKHDQVAMKLDSLSEQSSGAIDEDMAELGPSTVVAKRRRSASVRSMCTTLPEIQKAEILVQLGGPEPITEETSSSAPLSPSKDAGRLGREETTSGVNLPLPKKAATRRCSSCASSRLITNKTTTSDKYEQVARKLGSVSEQSSGAIDEDMVELGPSTVVAKRRRSASVRSVFTTLPEIQEAELPVQLGGLEPITEETSSSAPLSPSKDAGKPGKEETTSGVNPPLLKKAATRRRSSCASSRLTTNKTTTSNKHEQAYRKLDSVSEQSLNAVEEGMVGSGPSTVTTKRRRSTSVRSVCTTFPVIQEAELQYQLGGLGHIVEQTSLSASLSPSKDAGEPGKEETTSGVNIPLPKKAATRRRSSSSSSRLTTNKTTISDKHEQADMKLDSVSEQSSGGIDEDMVKPEPSTATANRRRSVRVRSRCSTFPVIQEAELLDQLGGLEPVTEETSSSASSLSPSKVAEGLSARGFRRGRRSSSAGTIQASSFGRIAQTGCSSYTSELAVSNDSVAAVTRKRRSLQPSARPTNVSSLSCRRYSSLITNSPAHASPNADPLSDLQPR